MPVSDPGGRREVPTADSDPTLIAPNLRSLALRFANPDASTNEDPTDAFIKNQGIYGTNAQQLAGEMHHLGANTTTEMAAISDWMDMANETGASGLFSGFQFPSNLGMHDFQKYLTWAEQFGDTVGWKYMPNPNALMSAYNKGLTTFGEVASMWGAKLPKNLQWVKYGYSAQQWDQYKQQNKARIRQRYGLQNVDDTHYVDDLDNEVNTGSGAGTAVGGLIQGQQPMARQESSIR